MYPLFPRDAPSSCQSGSELRLFIRKWSNVLLSLPWRFTCRLSWQESHWWWWWLWRHQKLTAGETPCHFGDSRFSGEKSMTQMYQWILSWCVHNLLVTLNKNTLFWLQFKVDQLVVQTSAFVGSTKELIDRNLCNIIRELSRYKPQTVVSTGDADFDSKRMSEVIALIFSL